MLLLAHLTFTLLLQAPRSRQRTPIPAAPNARGVDTDAVATFSGVFKSADKRFLTIGVEGGETMRMYITGSTKFIRDGKPAHARDFQSGENVTVDAARDARLNLLAVRVETAKAAKPPTSTP